jgi:hypothetical protein
LAALALHPEGLVVDVLLAGMSAPEERRPMLMALRTLERAGLVVRSGPRRHRYIAGVLVRLADQPPAICTTHDNAVIARRES